MTDHIQTGKVGEEIACKFLMKHGFTIVERNYDRKWGEIDIIAEKQGILHFIEVKTVSRGTSEGANPEDMVHFNKQKRLSRAIQTYISDGNVPHETHREYDVEWQFDIIAVFLNQTTRQAKVRFTRNIILNV